MEHDKTRGGPVAIRFDGVSFAYGPVRVLDDVNFHIHQGEFVALVGPNGAGKTTILKLLLGLEKPERGNIRLFEGMGDAGRERIGYVPQNAGFDASFPISVLEVVRMGRLKAASRKYGPDDERAVQDALERCGVADLVSRPYFALSGGQRRRVLVARALAARPLLLVLDEPTANMDSESEGRLFETLGTLKGSTTILIVTHDSSFVSSLTDIVLCVGDRGDARHPLSVVRHGAVPVGDVASDLYGGNALKVRHDEEMPDTFCCEEVKKP